MKKIGWILSLFLVMLLAACSSDSTETLPAQSTGTSAKPISTSAANSNAAIWSAANHDLLGSYSSTFLIQFSGPVQWKYTLQTRKASGLSENSLHIEGLDKTTNPGDIRTVTDSITTWMIGEGTDQECVQFPNNQGMDPKWITPESIVSPSELSTHLKLVGEEPFAGRESLHYAGSAARVDVWKDTRFELWLDKSTKALLKLEFFASGDDEFFWTGSGTLYAHYTVAGLNPGKIEPVPGCALSVPLPDSAVHLVRLPGLVSFESKVRVDEIRAFYQDRLPKYNWKEAETPAQSQTAVVLSYQRNAEKVEIHIEPAAGGGSTVKLLFLTGQ
jgi:hypothetical protein